MVDYFLTGGAEFHQRLGIDPDRLPQREEWIALVVDDLARDRPERHYHYVTWLIDGVASGHSNVNEIEFGHTARMHLHVWEPGDRARGAGRVLARLSAEHFCAEFDLDEIYCEPNAENAAPNRALEQAGFVFERRHATTPGWINLHQDVNRWTFACSSAP